MARPKPWEADDELWGVVEPLLAKVQRVLHARPFEEAHARHSGARDLPLAAWDPGTTALRAWLVERLVAEYRPLAATTDGTVLAGALLDAGLITPVLDGFDELPPALYGTGMRRLNAELDDGMPVLFTSRTTA
ncbi:hypothetical protein OG453_38255 [Streptomyces sp. NBC_01381]|uniref:hypothetical protein n=1 Tax=Streptomyces sp. NBC_01381 TaxID=2903845 RepID=UPI00225B54CF|nr:hypothetical protein [Streptomyces sp. NBC_01381]MCX4672432.1 hypothetical protein [Streptomyces sp. NBC_01381]